MAWLVRSLWAMQLGVREKKEGRKELGPKPTDKFKDGNFIAGRKERTKERPDGTEEGLPISHV